MMKICFSAWNKNNKRKIKYQAIKLNCERKRLGIPMLLGKVVSKIGSVMIPNKMIKDISVGLSIDIGNQNILYNSNLKIDTCKVVSCKTE